MYGRKLIKFPFSKEMPGTSKEVELGKGTITEKDAKRIGKKLGTLGMLIADKKKKKK
jgi:hypothetical protein